MTLNDHELTIFRILKLQFLKYSHILSLILFFYVSLTTVNVIHFIYTVILIVLIHSYNNLNNIQQSLNVNNYDKKIEKAIKFLWNVATIYT